MSALIASGTNDLASADFTLAAGESATLCLVDAGGPGVPVSAVASIQFKAASGEYFAIGELTGSRPDGVAQVLSAAGTYRVVRAANSTAFGVDKV
jgi:hypothetical protein